MKVEHERCDNPKCNVIGVPEDVVGGVPYGWIAASVDWFGCGPSLNVTVHNLRCLIPAIKRAAEREAMGV